MMRRMGPMIPGTDVPLAPPPEYELEGPAPPAWDLPAYVYEPEPARPLATVYEPGPVRPGRGVLPDMPAQDFPMIIEAPGEEAPIERYGEPPAISGLELIGTALTLWDVWQDLGARDEIVEVANGGVDMTMVRNGGMVPVSGPGVPEPPRAMVAKQWQTKAYSKTVGEYWVYFFRLIDGRIMCYNGAKKSWKMWRPKKPIVLYRGKVTLSQAVKVQRMLDIMWRRVAKNTKALKMATAATRRK